MDIQSSNESIYWEEELETLPRQDIEKLQLKRLKETLDRTRAVPFFQNPFKNSSVDPGSIKSLDDIRRLPVTEKDDLRKRWPYGIRNGDRPLGGHKT